MATTTDQDLQELKRNFNTLKSDLGALTDAVKELASDEARIVKVKAKKAEQQVEHQIEEHPMTSVGVAMGVGFIIGMLVDRQFR